MNHGPKGFAAMTAEKQREVASKGGRAAHQKGTAYEWTAEEARIAGAKGGRAARGGKGRLPTAAAPATFVHGTIPPGTYTPGDTVQMTDVQRITVDTPPRQA